MFAVASVWHQRTVLMQVINSLIFTDAPIWKGGAVHADSVMQREVQTGREPAGGGACILRGRAANGRLRVGLCVF